MPAPRRSTTHPVFRNLSEREAALSASPSPAAPAPSFPEPDTEPAPSFPEPQHQHLSAEPEGEHDADSLSDLPNPHGSDYDASDEKSALGLGLVPRRRATLPAPVPAPAGSSGGGRRAVRGASLPVERRADGARDDGATVEHAMPQPASALPEPGPAPTWPTPANAPAMPIPAIPEESPSMPVPAPHSPSAYSPPMPSTHVSASYAPYTPLSSSPRAPSMPSPQPQGPEMPAPWSANASASAAPPMPTPAPRLPDKAEGTRIARPSGSVRGRAAYGMPVPYGNGTEDTTTTLSVPQEPHATTTKPPKIPPDSLAPAVPPFAFSQFSPTASLSNVPSIPTLSTAGSTHNSISTPSAIPSIALTHASAPDAELAPARASTASSAALSKITSSQPPATAGATPAASSAASLRPAVPPIPETMPASKPINPTPAPAPARVPTPKPSKKPAVNTNGAANGTANGHASAPADAEANPTRPGPRPVPGASQMGTEYTHMLLAAQDAVPFTHNLAASAATWLLLAGFVVLPGTFSTLKTLHAPDGTLEAAAVRAVQHVSLFVLAYVLCGLGAGGMIWLWWRWRGNYVWLLARIFTPGALNGLAGLVGTLASVLGAQGAVFSSSAIVTVTVTGAVTVICGGLAGWYSFVLLRGVKRRHEREVGKEGAGKHGEGVIKAAKEVWRS